MATPFKMKGFGGFGNSPAKKTTGKGPTMPKDHPVTPPTEEQRKKSKGTLDSDLNTAKRGLGLTKAQLEEAKRKQKEALKEYEEKYG